MSDIQININRLTEVHQQIERARARFAAAKPALSVDASGSPALAAFTQRLDSLSRLIDLYAERLEADSRSIYQICTAFMDTDDALARAYRQKLGQGFSGEEKGEANGL